MGFVKVVKNKAYYKRYQVKFRRRRQGKTDYQQRRGLIIQDKNKYNTPKYRLVVRFTNRDCICQIISAKLEGDYVLAAAYAHELTNYGLPAKVGTSNYASAYATGLLVARRALTKLGLADLYKGVASADGEDYNVSTTDEASAQQDLKDGEGGGKRPFRVILDVGLARTTTGARVFGALKGACDGGLDIPHKTHRFPGANGDKEYDPSIHRKYIFGGHVAEYMAILKDEDKKRFDKQFSRFNAAGMTADKIEGIYKKVHDAIRANPVATKKARKVPATRRQRRQRLSAPQKKANAGQKIRKLLRAAQEA